MKKFLFAIMLGMIVNILYYFTFYQDIVKSPLGLFVVLIQCLFIGVIGSYLGGKK